MDVSTIISISAIVVPLTIVGGLMIWAFKVGKKTASQSNALKIKTRQLERSNNEKELLDILVGYKDKHIDLLRRKMGKVD